MKRIDLKRAKSQIARPNTIREINTQIVLNYVRDLAPISRAEIARVTNLQRSTVSSIVDALLRADLIEDIGTGDSTGGRKPNLLRIRTGSPVAIGVDVGPVNTVVAIADLAGSILDKEEFSTSKNADKETSLIISSISRFLKKYQNDELEVGLSVPGITDHANSSVTYVPYFRWHDWDICDRIENETGLKVTVDNDANAIALAELWFGREKIRKTRNFITVLVSEGIGTGVVFEGQVYRGEKGDAGEFGHMIVGSLAPVACSCGGFECWEAFASNTASQARFESALIGNGSKSSGANVIELALKGDEKALAALCETAKYLGIGISNLIVGLGPQAVVVSGGITQAWDLISEEVHKAVEKSIRKRLPRTVITASSLPSRPTLIGAVALVLARKFAAAS
ncbi:MAG: ROK family transcriptional regulator [Acidobacteriota bacterium]|nr:ROK family transcriptional regulator [Acidobacteriota bacterium]MDH3531027.1 ROK family transcriptional regulator [Acidobacteriota bacterium]